MNTLFHIGIIPSATGMAATPACTPADVTSIAVDPVADPYALGTQLTITGFQLAGTAPRTYELYINAVLSGTTYPFQFTLADGHVVEKDVNGLGVTRIWMKVFNPCNVEGASTSELASIPVQGLP